MTTHLQSLAHFSKEELTAFIDHAIILKKEKAEGVQHTTLTGKTVALVFEKPSTRTRVSFEAAVYGLGGQPLFIAGRDSQLSRSEPVRDTARVLSRYVDCLVVRTHGQEIIDELAQFASIPVINALSDLHHPCQILSDIMTVVEKKGTLDNVKIAWIGDGNNMANSWIEAAAILGFELALACPKGYEPDAAILAAAQKENSRITLHHEPQAAAKDADVLNTDVFASMGQEEEQEVRLRDFAGFQVNTQLMQKAKADAIVLHCLPAHRGEEISEEVLEGPHSVVFDEAENKLHMHKAILTQLITR